MTRTKKLLVAYDESKPTAGQGDFLVVVFEGVTPVFFGLRSRRTYKSGRMVFLGKEITEKEVFAKLVDIGREMESVDQTKTSLTAYLQQLGAFKIGNVVGVVPKAGEPGFELVKTAEVSRVSEPMQLP